MTEASGVFRLGESARAAFTLSRRFYGWRQAQTWGLLVLYLAGLPILSWLTEQLPLPEGLQSLIGLAAMLVYAGLALVFLWWWRRRMAIRTLVARGVPKGLQTTFAIAPDAMVVTTEIAETRLKWTGVSEVIRTKQHWLIVSGSLGYSLPRRFFDTPELEQAFIGEVVSHLGEEALARSRKAISLS